MESGILSLITRTAMAQTIRHRVDAGRRQQTIDRQGVMTFVQVPELLLTFVDIVLLTIEPELVFVELFVDVLVMLDTTQVKRLEVSVEFEDRLLQQRDVRPQRRRLRVEFVLLLFQMISLNGQGYQYGAKSPLILHPPEVVPSLRSPIASRRPQT